MLLIRISKLRILFLVHPCRDPRLQTNSLCTRPGDLCPISVRGASTAFQKVKSYTEQANFGPALEMLCTKANRQNRGGDVRSVAGKIRKAASALSRSFEGPSEIIAGLRDSMEDASWQIWLVLVCLGNVHATDDKS